MKLRPCAVHVRIMAFATAVLCLGSPFSTHAQTAPAQKGSSMSAHATGPFDVKLVPQSDDKVGDPTVGRMSIDKQYHGDLEATSKGQMLTAMTEIKGSAGFVAIERVPGKIESHDAFPICWPHVDRQAISRRSRSDQQRPDADGHDRDQRIGRLCRDRARHRKDRKSRRLSDLLAACRSTSNITEISKRPAKARC